MKSFEQLNFKRVVIAAYRLPYKLIRKKEEHFPVQNSGGLVSAIISLSEKMHSSEGTPVKICWVGTGEKLLAGETIRKDFELVPVELPHKIAEKYYGGFCNNTIWPLFHYFPSNTVFDDSTFDAYRSANELFLKKIAGLLKPGDFLWIHDYQLFLLPAMVRDVFPNANIGFFLHIPFPSYEMFRLLPGRWREAIISGILGSDIAGFHINDYAQHFIKSVKRTVGLKVDRNYITVKDRLCKADAFPIGIDFVKFHNGCFHEKTVHHKKKLKALLGDKRLMFSIDRLDFSKGFIFRLKAFERFLEKYPEWHFRVVFNMVVVPSRDNIERYKQLKTEIEAMVGRINGKYSTLSWRPIVYQYKSVSFNELVAIYDISDLGLITPLRDGMNLVAKEYVACQRENVGMLILSEMAGASVELNESIIISPTDVEGIADAINKALLMTPEEKGSRIKKMQSRLSRYNVFTWSDDFINQLTDVKKEQIKLQVKALDKKIIEEMNSKYNNARSRLFLFDYDGTLTPLMSIPDQAYLNKRAKMLIKALADDPANNIIIISGRKPDFIEEQFRNIKVSLIAEHGYFTKFHGENWRANYEIDLGWKKKILPVLNDYVDRCNGSFIEEKFSSLVWHYRNAEEDVASLRINELKDDLFEILKGESRLQLLEGDKVLEIKSIIYDKGTVAADIIKRSKHDFIIALGDDNTDEDLFRAIPGYGYTVKVGTGPTTARFFVKNQVEIYEILSSFIGNYE